MNFSPSVEDASNSEIDGKSDYARPMKNFTASKLTQFSSKYLVRHYGTLSSQDMSYDELSKLREPEPKASLTWPPMMKRYTLSAYQLDQLKNKNLFPSTMQVPSQEKPDDSSILITGFGMRNASSLARLLARTQPPPYVSKYQQMYGIDDASEEEYDMYGGGSPTLTATTSKSQISSTSGKSTSESMSQTETPASKKGSLDYLLGIEEAEEEEEEPDIELISPEVRESKEFLYSTSKCMRESQKYLRSHRVFEFFQFLIAHLLSSKTDNPVEFMLDLLNQCLCYRSGLGTPPLLYQKIHIEQLFKLMDRMNTGSVELDQYHTAMKTFGICSYNEKPTMTDNLVSKDVFMEEIYDAEVGIFNELIKRHRSMNKKQSKDFVVDDKCAKEFSQGSIHVVPGNFSKKRSKDMDIIFKNEPIRNVSTESLSLHQDHD